MNIVTGHITCAVQLHPVSSVSNKQDRFILHIVQGSAIRYLNEINCSVFGQVENHFVPAVCKVL